MDEPNAMRKLGRWAGRLRRGFLEGLHGGPPDPNGAPDSTRTAPPPDQDRRKVVVRRTTVEELEIHEPERR